MGCNETPYNPAGATMEPTASPTASPTADKCAQLETKMSNIPMEPPTNHTVSPEEEKAQKEFFQKQLVDMVKACRDGTIYDPCAQVAAQARATVESFFAGQLAQMEAEMQKQIDAIIEECKTNQPFAQLGDNWVDT